MPSPNPSPHNTDLYGSPDLEPSPADNHDAIVRLSQDVTALRQTSREVRRLRRQVRWLMIALFAALLIGGGTLVGIVLGFRDQQLALQDEQRRLTDQVEALEGDRTTAEQLGRLEEQLVALNQRTQALGDQARVLAEQLPNLTSDQIGDVQQRIQELEQGIRDNVSGEATTRRLDQLTGIIQRVLKRNENPLDPDAPTPPESESAN